MSSTSRWSECGSATVARRANDQAVTILNERILRLLGLLSRGDPYPFLWHQGPISVPQAMWALTSLRCTPQSLSLRVKPFPLCLSQLWALPCTQTEMPAFPQQGESEGKNPENCSRALGLSFLHYGIGNTKGVGAGSLGTWLEGT